MRWNSLFLRAHPTRAVLEALIIGITGWFSLFLLKQYPTSFIWQIGINLCIGLGCVLWCAVRLYLPDKEKRQQILFEVTTGGILCFLLAVIELLVTLILRQGTVSSELWQGPIRPLLLTAIAFTVDYSMFILYPPGCAFMVVLESLATQAVGLGINLRACSGHVFLDWIVACPSRDTHRHSFFRCLPCGINNTWAVNSECYNVDRHRSSINLILIHRYATYDAAYKNSCYRDKHITRGQL